MSDSFMKDEFMLAPLRIAFESERLMHGTSRPPRERKRQGGRWSCKVRSRERERKKESKKERESDENAGVSKRISTSLLEERLSKHLCLLQDAEDEAK